MKDQCQTVINHVMNVVFYPNLRQRSKIEVKVKIKGHGQLVLHDSVHSYVGGQE